MAPNPDLPAPGRGHGVDAKLTCGSVDDQALADLEAFADAHAGGRSRERRLSEPMADPWGIDDGYWAVDGTVARHAGDDTGAALRAAMEQAWPTSRPAAADLRIRSGS